MTNGPSDTYLRTIGRFVFLAARLEAQIVADERTAGYPLGLRRLAVESSEDFWERLGRWAATRPAADQEFLRTCADALYEVAVWRDRLAAGHPASRSDGNAVLIRMDNESQVEVSMDDAHIERLCGRIADWQLELDGYPRISRAGALWGAPDEDGRYLVRVVEFGDDASEEDYSAAGNMQMSGIQQAAEEYYGHPISVYDRKQFYRLVSGTHSSPVVAELADGTQVATKHTSHRGPGWQRTLRKPTPQEHARWAGLPVPPETLAGPPDKTMAEQVWQRLAEQEGTIFQTKRGLEFTYSAHPWNLWVHKPDGSGTSVDFGMITGALDVWPVAGPKALPVRCGHGQAGYVWAVLADRRILGMDRGVAVEEPPSPPQV